MNQGRIRALKDACEPAAAPPHPDAVNSLHALFLIVGYVKYVMTTVTTTRSREDPPAAQ